MHIALQKLQAVELMLHKMTFQLSGKMVALHFNNSTTKVIYVIRVVQHFPSRLACHILNLANKHGVTPIPAYIPPHLNGETNYLCQGMLVPKSYNNTDVCLHAFLLLCVNNCFFYSKSMCLYIDVVHSIGLYI